MLEATEVPAVAIETPDAAPSFVRTAFGHGALYILGGAVSQGMGFLLFPFFAHVLSPHDYGIIDLAGLAGTLVGVTVAFEISQGLGRYFLETTDPGERGTLASTAFIFTVATFSVAATIGLLLDQKLTVLLFGHGVRSIVTAVALVGMWCGGILYITQFLLQIQLRPAAFGVVTLVTTGVGLGTSAVLVIGFRQGALGFLIGQSVGAAAGSVAAFSLSRGLYRLRFDRGRLRRMLAYSVPLIPGSVGVFLNAYADRLAIRSRLGVAEVGVYGAGYRLALIVSLLLLGLQGALNPLVLSRHAEQETRAEISRLFRLFCAIALAVVLIVSLFAAELLHILTRPAYYQGAAIVPFVIAASFLGGMYVFAPGLNIAKRTRLFGLAAGLTGAVNLILAFGLVSPLGIRGPAIAFLVACAAGFVTLVALSQRVYSIPYDWRRLLPRVFAIAALVSIGAATLGETVSIEYILIKAGLALLGLAVIAGLVDRAELAELGRLANRLLKTSSRNRRNGSQHERAKAV